MNDGGLARFFCRLKRRWKICGLLNRNAEAAERPRVGGEVRIAQLRAGNAARIMALLVHPYGAVKSVVRNDDDDRRIKLDRGCEILTVHEEITIAAESHHRAGRVEALYSDRGG